MICSFLLNLPTSSYVGGFNVDNAKFSAKYHQNPSQPVTIYEIKANTMLT